MQLSSAILGLAALTSSYLAAPVAADEVLPWDGRGYDLTVDTLTDKYLTHILTQRKGAMDGNPADYVTVTPEGRSPAFNGDTGIITVAVDGDAIFNTQNNFRRSELVQNIAGNTAGTTFFRTSVMKEEAFFNKYAWQMIFPESHIFEIRVDATADPPMIIYLNNGTYDAKWETEFVPGTWYNFGIGVSKATSGSGSVIEFYTSEGDADLALEATHDVVTEFPTSYEFHYGLLTLSDDGSDPVMNAEQDILSYNGVSVEAEASTGSSSTVVSPTATSTASSASTENEVNTAAPAVSSATGEETTSEDASAEAATPESTTAPEVTAAAPEVTITTPVATTTPAAGGCRRRS